MALRFWPFNRNRQEEALPEEVKEFYESGRKQQTGRAWLLALGTLVVTVVLAFVLFAGGRWVYNKIAGDDKPSEPQTTETADQEGSNTLSSDSDDQQGSSSTSTDTPSSASTPASTPATSTPTSGGPSDSEIPDTGPGPGGLQ